MKPVHRAIAILTSAALAVGSPIVFEAPALAAACGTGTYAGGDGTGPDPYRIANANNLDELRDRPGDWACAFQQTSDIDMTGIIWRTNDAPNPSGIGNVGTKFTGTFNGGQFAISNLTIDGTVNTHAEPLGLFGNIDGGTVTGVNVSGTITSNHPFVGGLAGQVSSTTIEASTSSVNVSGDYEIGGLVGYVRLGTGSAIRNSSASGNVVGTDVGALVASVGGLVGHVQGNSTVIENSFASGNVTSNSREFLGGLVGRSGSGVTIRRSFATGSVNAPNASSAARSAGGLVGSADGTTLEDVYATGTVSVNNGSYVGGFVGKLRNSGGITRAYSTGLVTGTTSVVKGGFDGDDFSLPVTASLWDTETSGLATSFGGPGVKGKTTAQMTTIATYTDDTAGWNWNSGGTRIAAGFDPSYTWGICATVNNGYPFLTATYSVNPCASAPASPTLNSVAGGNSSLTLIWTLGSDGGSTVTDVEYSTDDSVTWRSVDDSTLTSDTIVVDSSGNPLVNGTTYQVRVRAVNSVGNGLVSNMLLGTPTDPTPPTPTPSDPPSDPLRVTGVAGNSQAVISWDRPASAGSFPITDYQVVVSPGGYSCLTVAPSTSCTITGLTNGTSYTAIVRALNGAGWGPWSDPSGAFTPADPVTKTIMITGTRADLDGRRGVRAFGETTGLVGATVQARVHLSGEVNYYDGSRRRVGDDGTFTWQRKTNKKVYVYFRVVDDPAIRSNRLIIPLG